MPRVYLAGPTVFRSDMAELFADMKRLCAEHGLEAVAPVDGGPPPETAEPGRAAFIRCANIALIRGCQAVVADISPFRGPGADAGTAWEMGFAEALGLVVVPYTSDLRDYARRVVVTVGIDGDFVDADGLTVEDFGLCDNLMLTAGAESAQPDLAAAVKRVADLLGATH